METSPDDKDLFHSSAPCRDDFDIFGLGHSLIDLSVRVPSDTLAEFGLDKGQQRFVSDCEIRNLIEKINHIQMSVGGDVRNTLSGISALGDRSAFCSTVGSDDYANLIKDNLRHHGIHNKLYIRSGATPLSLILISPDGERSMVTFSGDDRRVHAQDLDLEAISKSKILYTSAYMLNDSHRTQFLKQSLLIAKRTGTLFAFDLADPSVVRNFGDEICAMIDQGVIDILFGNEAEMKELCHSSDLKKINSLRTRIPILVIKKGAEGALIVTPEGNCHVASLAKSIVDTTAAGDMFAAGFLFGLLHSLTIEMSAKFAAFMAADTIQYVGATLSTHIKMKAKDYLMTLDCCSPLPKKERSEWLCEFREKYSCQNSQISKKLEMKIQIAGIKSFDEAKELLDAGVDMIGFPLALPVHRPDLSEEDVAHIVRRLQTPEKCLLITYLNHHKDILALAKKIGVRNIQLHGDVSLEELKMVKQKMTASFIIKSIIVTPHSNQVELLEVMRNYHDWVDAFIIDTFDPTTGASGATGKTHDWTISKCLVEASARPVILAGGLNPQNVYQAIIAVKPQAVDVHTGVEDSRGNKDAGLVADFVREANRGFRELEQKGVL